MGHHFPANSAIDALRQVYEELEQRDAQFPIKFTADIKKGKRPYLAKDAEALFPKAPHLQHRIKQLSFGWIMDTNISSQSIQQLIKKACKVANLEYGRDLIVHF